MAGDLIFPPKWIKIEIQLNGDIYRESEFPRNNKKGGRL
jgi:hypothetical protein